MNKLQASVHELRPRITVIGIGGAGCNAVNNMIDASLQGVDFVVANTDAQALANSHAEHKVQLGAKLTEGLGAGSRPEIGEAAAEEAIDDIRRVVEHSHMVFIAAGMGGGTGTGAAAVVARTAREMGILTVAVVTKPFQFEGSRRQRIADAGIAELRPHVDTLIVIPNQNLFRIASDKTTFAEAFVMADQVLYSGVACIVDLIVKEGLINLDFADVRTVMAGMGTAMMGTGEASGEERAIRAAEEAISNPLLDDVTLQGAKGLLLSITGGSNLTLYEVDEAASRVRQEVDPDANIIVGATFDNSLGDRVRVSIVASGMARLQTGAPHGGEIRPVPHTAAGQRETGAQAFHSASAPAHAAPAAASQSESLGDYGAGLASALRGYPEPEYAPVSEPPPLPQAGPSWHDSDDVDIEERRPGAFAQGGYGPVSGPHGTARLQPAYDDFQPQSPAELRRPVRRMPEVEDFPAVGQREYYAKAGPRSAPAPTQREPRKRSFFERLMGGGKNRDDHPSDRREPAPAPAHSGSPPHHEAHRPETHHARHDDPGLRPEKQELPVFFTRSRR